MLPVRFRAILRRQPFSSSLSLRLISRPFRERSFYNLHGRPLLIINICSEYVTCMISHDSETATFFARAIAHANSRPSRERSIYNFCARPLPIFVIWPKYLSVQFHAISRRQPLSHAQSLMQISQPSRERSFHNFRARPLPIFFIWPKYATRAISCDSKTATFFTRAMAHAIILALSGAPLL